MQEIRINMDIMNQGSSGTRAETCYPTRCNPETRELKTEVLPDVLLLISFQHSVSENKKRKMAHLKQDDNKNYSKIASLL